MAKGIIKHEIVDIQVPLSRAENKTYKGYTQNMVGILGHRRHRTTSIQYTKTCRHEYEAEQEPKGGDDN